MLKDIEEALALIKYPNKDGVWKLAQRLGKKHQGLFPSYKFVPRGGLSSPYVKFVTDVDLIFNNPKSGYVAVEDFDKLYDLAMDLCQGSHNIMSAKVSCGDTDLFDKEVKDRVAVRRSVSEGADVVVITGRFTLPGGWCVPLDLTLQRGDAKMSKEARIQRICGNIGDENFAKVVQRIRPMLGKAIKAKFAEAWNESGGALRFLVKQLEMLVLMPPKERNGYRPRLHLASTRSDEEWGAAADEEMQWRALALLWDFKDLIAPALGEDAELIISALEAAWERGRGSVGQGSGGEGGQGDPGSSAARSRQAQPQAKPVASPLAERLPVGTQVSAMYSDGNWYAASVMQVRKKSPEVKVHYLGYDDADDQWLPISGLRSKYLRDVV